MTAVYIGHNEVANYLSNPAVVDYIVPNSAAAKAGLQHGDRILRFDTVENPTWEQIFEHAALNFNHSVSIEVQQPDGAQKETSLFLKSPSDPDDFSLSDVGLTPVEQNSPMKVTMVDPAFPGAKAGLKVGDEIVSVDGTQLHSLPSMILYLQQNGNKPVTLSILRNGNSNHADGDARREPPAPDGQPSVRNWIPAPSRRRRTSNGFPSRRHFPRR